MNKVKWFGKYIGCNVETPDGVGILAHPIPHNTNTGRVDDIFNHENGDVCVHFDEPNTRGATAGYYYISKCTLILKKISQVTLEEAQEVVRILGYSNYKSFDRLSKVLGGDLTTHLENYKGEKPYEGDYRIVFDVDEGIDTYRWYYPDCGSLDIEYHEFAESIDFHKAYEYLESKGYAITIPKEYYKINN